MTQLSLFSEEPHRVNSNDLVGTLGAGPHPEGVGWPAEWFATSHDVMTRLMFYKRAGPFPRLTAYITLSKNCNSTIPVIRWRLHGVAGNQQREKST